MEIAGPLQVGIAESSSGMGHELHIDFRPEFRSLSVSERASVFRTYLAELSKGVRDAVEDDPDRAGMMLSQQVVEQLLPHIDSDERAMNDIIVVEVGQTQGISLTSMLN